MASGTPSTPKDRDCVTLIEQSGQLLDLVLRRAHLGMASPDGGARLTVVCLLESDIARNRHNGHTLVRQRGLDGDLEHPRDLARLRNQFAVMATIAKKLVRMGFLKVIAADLLARNLRGK